MGTMSLLVVGATGFIGSAFRRTPHSSDIYTSRTTNLDGVVAFDPMSGNLQSLARLAGVTHALLLFAEREPDACVRAPRATWRVNVEAPCRLIDQCCEAGIIPIFASSELVFDGDDGMYTESHTPHPVLEYGRQKLATEQYLLKTCPDGLVLRFPKSVGRQPNDKSIFTTWVRQSRSGVDVLKCAYDQKFSLQWVEDVPNIVRTVMRTGTSGILHLGDGLRHSRLELLEALLSALKASGIDVPRVRRVSIRELVFPEVRPKDVSLDSSRLREITKITAPSVPEIVRAVIRQAILHT